MQTWMQIRNVTVSHIQPVLSIVYWGETSHLQLGIYAPKTVYKWNVRRSLKAAKNRSKWIFTSPYLHHAVPTTQVRWVVSQEAKVGPFVGNGSSGICWPP